MGLGDRFRRIMGIPDPPDPLAERRAALRRALEQGDEDVALGTALGFFQGQRFDDALDAFAQMEQRFPARRAEWLRWQGQALYIGLGFRAANAAARAGLYRRALDCYFRAAELGDRTQEFNVVELCEALCAEPAISPEDRRALRDRYLALFPAGEGRARVERLG